MDELIAFVRARLDEDERTARGAARTDDGHGGRWLPVYFGSGGFDARVDDHIARHDPARVLREVTAKRMLLEQFRLRGNSVRAVVQPVTGGVWDDLLLVLALPYNDHPDCRPEWKP